MRTTLERPIKGSIFLDAQGHVVATGHIDRFTIDLKFLDGTRFYSTMSDGFTFLKDLNIAKVLRGA